MSVTFTGETGRHERRRPGEDRRLRRRSGRYRLPARQVDVSAADVTAVIAIGAALCGGIWIMLTDSTRARKAQEKARERERRYYDQRIKDMEDDQ